MAGQEDILGTSAVMQAATQIIIVNRPEIFNIAEDHEGHSWEGRARIGLIKKYQRRVSGNDGQFLQGNKPVYHPIREGQQRPATNNPARHLRHSNPNASGYKRTRQ
jgi:hypothetical protein